MDAARWRPSRWRVLISCLRDLNRAGPVRPAGRPAARRHYLHDDERVGGLNQSWPLDNSLSLSLSPCSVAASPSSLLSPLYI